MSFKKGYIPWNKGKHYTSKSTFKKGKHYSFKTEFKKGSIPWSKGKKFPEWSGKKHPQWKGNEVGYNALHKWVCRRKGKANHCENCGDDKKYKDPRHYQWANIDHKYRRVLEDYIPLCRKCHREYDKKFNF